MPERRVDNEPWEADVPDYLQRVPVPIVPNHVTPPPEAPARKRLTLVEAQERLQEATQEFLDLADHADPPTVRRFMVRLQKLRIATALLDPDTDDTTLTKEMRLMNQLISGKGASGLSEGNPEEDEDLQEARAKLLATRGVHNPAQAERIVRVLESVFRVGSRATDRALAPAD